MKKIDWKWIALLILVSVISRWVPHPPDFTAMLATALIAGWILPGPLGLVVPVVGVFAGDLLGFLVRDPVLGFHDLMWVVYLSLLPMVWIGRSLPDLNKKPRTWLGWGLAGLVASVIFFITTNLAVWWMSGMYPHTQAGFISCFVLAIPYFHKSVLSTWIYMGAFAAVRHFSTAKSRAAIRAA